MPACHIDHAGLRRLAFLDDPKLLKRRPTPSTLWTRQNRNLAHVCSFACKSISKLSQPRLPIGRRSSPEGYPSPKIDLDDFHPPQAKTKGAIRLDHQLVHRGCRSQHLALLPQHAKIPCPDLRAFRRFPKVCGRSLVSAVRLPYQAAFACLSFS